MKKTLRVCAMDFLARREHSQKELFSKLCQKGFQSDEVVDTLNQLQCDKLIDDQRFTENYVHHRVAAGLGPLRIVVELKERGISESLIEQTVWQGEINWSKKAYTVWQKKYRCQERFGSKQYAQQFRFLLQRGYPQDIIREILQPIDD